MTHILEIVKVNFLFTITPFPIGLQMGLLGSLKLCKYIEPLSDIQYNFKGVDKILTVETRAFHLNPVQNELLSYPIPKFQ